jgi:hypothetical protein
VLSGGAGGGGGGGGGGFCSLVCSHHLNRFDDVTVAAISAMSEFVSICLWKPDEPDGGCPF